MSAEPPATTAAEPPIEAPPGPAEGGSAGAPVDAVLRCPVCAASVAPGEQFCEACGSPLRPPCPSCGGAVAADGYCEQCGARAPSERDHFEDRPAEWVGAVCDRGVRHHRNEDAMAVFAEPDAGALAVLVVCDGVSNTPDSDVASLAAAIAARDVLVAARPGPDAGPEERATVWEQALRDAADAANTAATDALTREVPNPPSCTFVVGIADGPVLRTGCVGDSRAYWVPDSGGPVQLTVDDSWAAEQIALGMPREEAESAPKAHAITRWLGRDSPEHTPSTGVLTATGAGWFVVCSDGLWNYGSEAAELRAVLVDEAGDVGVAGVDPLLLAGRLVDWANRQGGQDNITVALARITGQDQG